MNTAKLTATELRWEPHSAELFFQKHELAMRELCNRIELPEEEIDELIAAVANYFA